MHMTESKTLELAGRFRLSFVYLAAFDEQLTPAHGDRYRVQLPQINRLRFSETVQPEFRLDW